MYVSYKCTHRRRREHKCKNPEINRDKLESAVLQRLSAMIFNPKVIPTLVREYNEYIAEKSGNSKKTLDSLKKELSQVDNQIRKAVDLMIETGAAALKEKLAELEATKEKLKTEINRLTKELKSNSYTEDQIRALFQKAEEQLKTGSHAIRRVVVDQYVDKAVIFPDKIEVYFKIFGGFERKETIATEK